MDDRSISWMISGGLRAETRESRLQHEHRQALRTTNGAAYRDPAVGWRERVALALRPAAPTTSTSTFDCCAV